MNGEKNKSKLLRGAVLVLLLVATLLFCLVSCKGEEQQQQGEETVVGADQIATLLKGNLNSYQIVRPETMSGDALKIALSFVNIVRQNGYNEIQMVSDYVELAPVTDYEIIIGETTRKGAQYNEGEGVIVQTDDYTVCIVESRLVFTYTNQKGMIDGLEFLLFSVLEAEQSVIREAYDLELFDRGVRRYSYSSFSLKNFINDGTVLTAGKDLLFFGTSTPESKVSIQLTKGKEVISSFDAVTDSDGMWQTFVKPDTNADSIFVRIDGNIAERYSDISFAENKTNACEDGTKVYINGEQIDVHANEGGNYVVASLAKDAEKKMEIKLVRRYKVNDCVVRPLSDGIEPDINGKEITFTVTEFPCKLMVELEDFAEDPKDSVQLFLYDYEEYTPDLSNGEVIYYAPGEYWVEQNIGLSSNTTVYLEEGAVLHGRFEVKNARNVSIMGRGIIDTYYFKVENNMMVFEGCTNVTLKDYMLTGPRKWMTVLKECDTCLVERVNILGTEINSDGVDIVGSKNVTVKDCFLRTNDDGIAVKSHASDVNNVKVTGCIFWNERYGNALEIGYETRCDNITDITFEDNDLLYVSGACMSIHLSDRANVSGIKYKDIRVENSNGKLIDYFIKTTQYTKDIERGHISNVTIDGVVILGDSLGRLVFEGFDEAHAINNVAIGPITFGGKVVDNISSFISYGDHVSNITYNGKSIV